MIIRAKKTAQINESRIPVIIIDCFERDEEHNIIQEWLNKNLNRKQFEKIFIRHTFNEERHYQYHYFFYREEDAINFILTFG